MLTAIDAADLPPQTLRYLTALEARAQAARDELFGGPLEMEEGNDTPEQRRNLPAAAVRLPQEFFTPEEIAQYLGLSTYTIQELCRRGDLRHVRFGRSIRIRRQWADAYMTGRERTPLQ